MSFPLFFYIIKAEVKLMIYECSGNESEVVILEEVPLTADKQTANSEPVLFDENLKDSEEAEKRAINILRYQKASATRKAGTKYRKNVKNAVQTLMDGTYCTLTDGTGISCAEMIGIGLVERAMHSDKAAKLLLEITGDIDQEKESKENNYEEFIKNVTTKF